MKYLVIFKLNPFKEDVQDHVIEADGFTRTDFDVVLWKHVPVKQDAHKVVYEKHNVALYQIAHIVCVAEMSALPTPNLQAAAEEWIERRGQKR